ncbi:hypothetical protein DICPUDRAFT_56276 [Dictyostelium purpureum]|uniref:PA14 domain-containing protein n=1 Tax=Dictyostelium purpureum TaxID=5786 RepID=F0ZQI7_DICPU|nr:uncharacterized protein DICPUDRAFT_56276 [Dictyostelium purpureum]EGC33811.1 hypothetical protein DICPUDRAFT_56276 [Dictyostelium purpureum]|eukprot:XP_003289682.1 hypothetical protein DICPUDRAFT_56276 [Dictyostelium purpureum]
MLKMKYINYFILHIIFFVLFINIVKSQKTIVLSGTIYDQNPKYNPNFEPNYGKLTKNLVKSVLNPVTRVPELNSLNPLATTNRDGRMIKPELFQYFFSPNNNASSPGYNIPIPINLTLDFNSDSGTYTYSNQNFFPIDYQGFDVDPSKRLYKDEQHKYHNYHFCLKINSNFLFKGGEMFKFVGDDDFFVFIDNKLVIDLGGLHLAESASVNLNSLGLTKGNVYPIDFFYCERHTTKSTIRFDTNILITCNYYDYCGICNGDGTSCCNAQTTCNDNNPCTTDKCPSPTTKIFSPIPNYCIHTPLELSLPSDNICFTKQCNSTTGKIDSFPITCLDLSNNCLKSKGCNSTTGCQYESTCNNACQVKNQCNNGTCVVKSSDYCAKELDGDSADICSVYSCDSSQGGCIKQEKCQQSSNKCLVHSCDSSNGNCLVENVPKPNSNDSCEVSICDPVTGLYSSSPLQCPDRSNECLTLIASCKAFTGECFEIEIPGDQCDCGCEIKNKCMRSHCTREGKCSPLLREEIDDGNTCTDDYCDPCTGLITHATASKCLNCNSC